MRLRRRVRAAARPRLQRDLRGDRQLPVELAAAAGHRRGPVRRPDGAGPVQRLRRRDVQPTGSGSSTSTRCSGATITSRTTIRGGAASGSPAPAARRTSCGWWPPSGTTWPRPRVTCSTCTSSPGPASAASWPAATCAVDMTTDYPWSGRSTSGCASAPPADCGLAVRVPGWSRDARVRAQRRARWRPDPAGRGYLIVRRHWQPGDVLALRPGPHAAADLPEPAHRRAAGDRGGRARPARVLLRAGRPARGRSLEDLALTPAGSLSATAEVPGIGPTVLIEADAARPGAGAAAAGCPTGREARPGSQPAAGPPPWPSPTSSGTTATAGPCGSGCR